MRKAVRTSEASAGDGPYSQAIVSGGFVFVSGQGPLDLEGRVVGDTIEEQTALTLSNIERILQAAGCSMDDVVKVNVILADISEFSRFNAVYRTYFQEPMPARTCFEGGLDQIRVEIDVIAKSRD
ncbi:RidA family protein [Paenibacillus hemerocallicola]|uniref:RidA family protein n=1 Tax=Paenibacillus hemerocallicola TaxID=1172614 RepID=A0A5C4TIE7_9BACL|nr:Rid family detoxifying hydrolase [Paenibacillus hemerocallicola]TNJ68377.1 RidA family protein [Paenibacillus hemerocallicola]